MSQKSQIMSPEQVQRTWRRLAYEVVERNRGVNSIEVVGIRRRGTLLARALAEEIQQIANRPVSVHDLDTRAYRDDLENSVDDKSAMEGSLEDRDVILVDDVLFTGRTARAALDAVIQYGRPRSIQLAVLIDRGHREYPIRPDYVGRKIPTRHREYVEVQLLPEMAVFVNTAVAKEQ